MQPDTRSNRFPNDQPVAQGTSDASLIRAATDLYVQDAVHDRDQNRRYEELAIHFLPKVGISDRIYIAERLADRRDAPEAVIRLLARDVIDVAAAVLTTSPVTDTLTLLSTIAVTDSQHHRLIARRKDLPEQVRRALRLTGDPEVLRLVNGDAAGAIASETASLDQQRHAPSALRETHRDGRRFLSLSRRDRLAVLVDFASRAAGMTTLLPRNRLDGAFRSILSAAKIAGLARAGQREEMLKSIAEGLALAPDFVQACIDDQGGEAFAILLRGLRLEAVQAYQVLLLATPAGRDPTLFFPLADLFAGMAPEVAEMICDTWRAAAAGQSHGHVAYDDADDRRSTTGQARPAAVAPRIDESKRA